MRRTEISSADVSGLIDQYVARLALPTEHLWVTDQRTVFAGWLGRRVPASYGGAYCFLSQANAHAVLINTPRIDLGAPHALEIVVCEELVHMRDHLDGDHRRHAHHGHDRITFRVAELTGASLEEIRTCLLPLKRRPPRYVYRCWRCGMTVRRRVRGTWSCGRCSPVFRADLTLVLIADEAINGSVRS